MSKLEDLVHEISYTVEKLTSRINEERSKISNFRERQKRVTRHQNDGQLQNMQLQSDIERLECTIFREIQQSKQLGSANDLVEKRMKTLSKSIEEIQQVSETMRKERSNVLEEYHEKINNYEHILQKNNLLRNFVEKWRENVEQNRELKVFPNVIRNLANSLCSFYPSDIVRNLEDLVPSKEAQEQKRNVATEADQYPNVAYEDTSFLITEEVAEPNMVMPERGFEEQAGNLQPMLN